MSLPQLHVLMCFQCDVVMNLSASQRCEFVKNTPDCASDEGFIKYPFVTFCLFTPSLLPLAITIYVRTIWLSHQKFKLVAYQLIQYCETWYAFVYILQLKLGIMRQFILICLNFVNSVGFLHLIFVCSFFLSSSLLFPSGYLAVVFVPRSWTDCIRLVSCVFKRIRLLPLS